jgi:hypothetical protein
MRGSGDSARRSLGFRDVALPSIDQISSEVVPLESVRGRTVGVRLFGDGVSGGEVAAPVGLGQRLQSSAVAG